MVHAAQSAASSPQNPLVRIERIEVNFARHAVLRNIDLAIDRGETIAIIGESGCGKTVLLKTVIALQRPSRAPSISTGGISLV